MHKIKDNAMFYGTLQNAEGMQVSVQGHLHTQEIEDEVTALLLTDGKIKPSLMPTMQLVDRFTANSEAEMLALAANTGDICIRIDLTKTYMLTSDTPTVLADWQEVAASADAVLSVAGKIGVVVLTKSDVGLSNVDNTSDEAKPVSTAMQDALSFKVGTDRVLTDVPMGAKFTDTIYTHPESHPASMITEDADHRWATDQEKRNWNSKATSTIVTYTTNGLMRYADKVKLDGITGTNTGDQVLPTSLPANDVFAWAKQPVKPIYTPSEVGALPTSHAGAGAGAHAMATTSMAGFMTPLDKTKLDGIAIGANRYTHPETHPPTIIEDDAEHRWTTDAEKAKWNSGTGGSGGVSAFKYLTDVPQTYVGAAKKLVAVNADETGLVFTNDVNADETATTIRHMVENINGLEYSTLNQLVHNINGGTI